MVTKERKKKWIILCLGARDGSALPEEISKYVWDNYEVELCDSDNILFTW